MSNAATLLHPLECPICHMVVGHEIQFLHGYFSETQQIDLRLGELMDLGDEEEVHLFQPLQKGFRTHGVSLCLACNGTVVSLLAIRGGKVVQIEVFPRVIQMVLSMFPSCLFLNSSDDKDMVFLSEMIQIHGAKKVSHAIETLSRDHYSQDYWNKRKQKHVQLTGKHEFLKDFLNLLQDRDGILSPDADTEEHPPPPTDFTQALEKVFSGFSDQKFLKDLETGQWTYSQEQDHKHSELKTYLEKRAS
jgi:hypothetical protein